MPLTLRTATGRAAKEVCCQELLRVDRDPRPRARALAALESLSQKAVSVAFAAGKSVLRTSNSSH